MPLSPGLRSLAGVYCFIVDAAPHARDFAREHVAGVLDLTGGAKLVAVQRVIGVEVVAAGDGARRLPARWPWRSGPEA